jgi:hypothetical protein
MTAARTRSIIALLGLATLATSAMPHAKADQYDYINQLDAHGVYYNSISSMIDDGKIICAALRSQEPLPQILHDVVTKGGFSQTDSMFVVGLAVKTMCPDTLDYVQNNESKAIA